MSQNFAPTQTTTDYNRDPYSVFIGAFIIFWMSKFLFVNGAEIFNTSIFGTFKESRRAQKSGAWAVIVVLILLGIQIGAWVKYRNDLGTIAGAPGYLFSRDVLMLSLSILSFLYVFLCVIILAGGLTMSPDEVEKDKMRLALIYFEAIFYTAYYSISSSIVWAYNNSDHANIPSPAQGIISTGSALLLASAAAMIIVVYFRTMSVLTQIARGDEPVAKFAYATGNHAALHMITPATSYHAPIFILANTIYTITMFIFMYMDYVQFSLLAMMVLSGSIFHTFVSKNIDTYSFYFFYTIWFVSTISYLVCAFAPGTNAGGTYATWTNLGANLNPLQLNASDINFPSDYTDTLKLTQGLMLTSCGLAFVNVGINKVVGSFNMQKKVTPAEEKNRQY